MWIGRSHNLDYELALKDDWDNDFDGFESVTWFRGDRRDNILATFCASEFHKRTNIRLKVGERRRVKSITFELHPAAKSRR